MGQKGNPETKNKTISVLVADSTPLTAHLIADALRRDRGLTVNDASGTSILTEVLRLQPDITILSENLEGSLGRGFAVLKQLRAAAPQTRTIMLLDGSERDSVVEAFRSGARGVFSRNDPLKMLGKCVRRVFEGQLWVSSPQFQFLLEALSDAPTTRLVDTKGANLLSRREEDVVRGLAEGLTNSEIAREMEISENTVKNYVFRIFNKLGVSSRVEVVIYASSQRPQT
jgi:two-component system, NarL family, nitrate/nitrite response regulator NarL